jgi:L-aspartate oxidase
LTQVDHIVETDGALILGAGIAGLFTALKLETMPSIVLAGTRPGLSGSSAWAQGGIAASLGQDDSWQNHAHDTMVAGAGLCDPAIVELVARDAPARIEDLVGYGVAFDRRTDGRLALGREAAHGLARIVHVKGDGAGAAISATLAAQAGQRDCITLLEGFHAVELAVENGQAIGLFARSGLLIPNSFNSTPLPLQWVAIPHLWRQKHCVGKAPC